MLFGELRFYGLLGSLTTDITLPRREAFYGRLGATHLLLSWLLDLGYASGMWVPVTFPFLERSKRDLQPLAELVGKPVLMVCKNEVFVTEQFSYTTSWHGNIGEIWETRVTISASWSALGSGEVNERRFSTLNARDPHVFCLRAL